MKRNLKNGCISLVLMLSFAVEVWAQSAEKPTSVQLAAKADEMAKQTFKRKSGEVLTFEQIDKLPEKQKDIILDEMSDEETNRYENWLRSSLAKARAATAAANAQGVEIDEATILNLKKIFAIRGKFPANYIELMKKIIRENESAIRSGSPAIKPESIAYLKSLLARPELFEK